MPQCSRCEREFNTWEPFACVCMEVISLGEVDPKQPWDQETTYHSETRGESFCVDCLPRVVIQELDESFPKSLREAYEKQEPEAEPIECHSLEFVGGNIANAELLLPAEAGPPPLAIKFIYEDESIEYQVNRFSWESGSGPIEYEPIETPKTRHSVKR